MRNWGLLPTSTRMIMEWISRLQMTAVSADSLTATTLETLSQTHPDNPSQIPDPQPLWNSTCCLKLLNFVMQRTNTLDFIYFVPPWLVFLYLLTGSSSSFNKSITVEFLWDSVLGHLLSLYICHTTILSIIFMLHLWTGILLWTTDPHIRLRILPLYLDVSQTS